MANRLESLCRELCLLMPARLVRGEAVEKWLVKLLKALCGTRGLRKACVLATSRRVPGIPSSTSSKPCHSSSLVVLHR